MFDRLARRIGVSVVLLLAGAVGGWFLRAQSAAPVQAQAPAGVDESKLAKAVEAALDRKLAANSEDARANSLASTFQTIRAQLELYRLQHDDNYPTLEQLAGWRVMVERTMADGSAGKDFGPYLQSAPVNPLTGHSAVVAAGKATLSAGWTLDSKAGRLYAVVPESFRGRASDVLGAGDAEFVAD